MANRSGKGAPGKRLSCVPSVIQDLSQARLRVYLQNTRPGRSAHSFRILKGEVP
ncbi:MAG: hypothetical protein KatS3mg024_1427 [Armatimonadota bacterium]|jgi:hypothetical protein|nr:MAG: hypothetical protein KatS3mg024_1427 [Armatimonadota bacterium]